MASFTIRVATANVLCTLDRAAAGRSLSAVLAERPDVVLLQEWALKRAGVLMRSGSVCVLAPVGLGEWGDGDYRWFAPVTGGCAVGLRRERFAHARARLRSLSLPGWSEGQMVQPGRTGVEVAAFDLHTQRHTTALSYHLVPGSQAGQGYDPHRPHQSARHQREHRHLQRAVDGALARGDVYAGGDSNFDGFALDGLISAWTGAPHAPNRIDDVFATRAPSSVMEIETESDHRALVVDYRAD